MPPAVTIMTLADMDEARTKMQAAGGAWVHTRSAAKMPVHALQDLMRAYKATVRRDINQDRHRCVYRVPVPERASLADFYVPVIGATLPAYACCVCRTYNQVDFDNWVHPLKAAGYWDTHGAYMQVVFSRKVATLHEMYGAVNDFIRSVEGLHDNLYIKALRYPGKTLKDGGEGGTDTVMLYMEFYDAYPDELAKRAMGMAQGVVRCQILPRVFVEAADPVGNPPVRFMHEIICE